MPTVEHILNEKHFGNRAQCVDYFLFSMLQTVTKKDGNPRNAKRYDAILTQYLSSQGINCRDDWQTTSIDDARSILWGGWCELWRATGEPVSAELNSTFWSELREQLHSWYCGPVALHNVDASHIKVISSWVENQPEFAGRADVLGEFEILGVGGSSIAITHPSNPDVVYKIVPGVDFRNNRPLLSGLA